MARGVDGDKAVVAVLPSSRRRGVVARLVEECVTRSRALGASAVGLHTTSLMSVARGMYERMGFVRVPQFDFHPRPDMTVDAYRLDLSEAL